MFDRTRLVNQLKSRSLWDVIVVGGGATGLGIALDSVTRGYSTLLLEQSDFAKGTSSRSTKLVHGGVRYLAQGNIDLVKESLYERGVLYKNATHLVGNQSFIIPNYSWWDHFFYTFGLKIYDFLAGKLSLGASHRISKEETISRLHTVKLEKLKGGVVYHDGQFDDSRLAINLAQTAIEHGATVLNYFKVENLLKNDSGKINGVQVKDVETESLYSINGKVVINATGVFADAILKMDDAAAKKRIQPSQGVHLVLDKSFLPGNDAIMIPKTSDGRVLFLVPWYNRIVVGTTDTLVDSYSLEPLALKKEIAFILETANRYLTKQVTENDVLSVFAGLRPLVAPGDKSKKTKEISRSHKIIISNSGLISITGGKWTTYRRMAQDTLNKAIALKKLPVSKCKTKNLLIHGAKGDVDRSNRLYIYGSDQKALIDLKIHVPEYREKLHPDLEFTKAEVIWAIRNEMARTVDDVLSRRVRVLFLDAKVAMEIAPVVAVILAKELQKSDDWISGQIKDFNQIARNYSV